MNDRNNTTKSKGTGLKEELQVWKKLDREKFDLKEKLKETQKQISTTIYRIRDLIKDTAEYIKNEINKNYECHQWDFSRAFSTEDEVVIELRTYKDRSEEFLEAILKQKIISDKIKDLESEYGIKIKFRWL